MARMIPPSIPADAPKGERLLFARLRDDPDTREWIVFHSFDIRRHIARHEGEADMLVVAPGHGVLCLEVKGCDVSRKNGQWVYPYGTSPVGPFRQASDAAHSIRHYLGNKDISLANLLFYSAVVFTEIEFAEKSLEWHTWQIVGRTEFLRKPISSLMIAILGHARESHRNRKPTPSWYEDRTSRPSVKQSESIARLLRSDFEYTGSPQHGVELAEASIKRYTEEQFDAVDHLLENRRILFKGPAGTGKTFLAIESARRSVRDRNRTALLCFNTLLGEWLKKETAAIAMEAKNTGVTFFAGTFSSLMLSIARKKIAGPTDRDFWRHELPKLAIDKLLSDETETPMFDMLLVDEAQDLLTEANLDVLDLISNGGLAGGRWAIFGDFERQAIYMDGSSEAGLNLLRRRTGAGTFTFRLRINCRNSVRIAEAVTIAAGMSPGYSRVLHEIESTDVEPIFYRNISHQAQALQSCVTKLLRKFLPEQIVILSMRADADCCASTVPEGVDGIRFVPFRQTSDNTAAVRYASVHAFKGLESAAIVLTDVDQLETDHARALLYIGMSRARVQLYAIMSHHLRPIYGALLDAGLKAALGKT